jgi:phospholipid/cholesterol/gamma-HCH transport system substrate-binding protein
MRSRYVGVGIFVVVGSLLFATTVFLIGNQHNFFSKHIELFTEVKNLNGLRKGPRSRSQASTQAKSRKSAFPKHPPLGSGSVFGLRIRCAVLSGRIP